MSKETQPTVWQTTEALSAIVRLLTIHGAMTGKVLRRIAHDHLGGISNPVISSALASGIKRGLLERIETEADGLVYTPPASEDESASKAAPPAAVSTPAPPAEEQAPTAPVATYRAQCERCRGWFTTAVNGNFLCDGCRGKLGQPLAIPPSVTTTPNPVIAPPPIRRMCTCGQWYEVKNPPDDPPRCMGCEQRVRQFAEESRRINPHNLPGRITTGYVGSR